MHIKMHNIRNLYFLKKVAVNFPTTKEKRKKNDRVFFNFQFSDRIASKK